MRGKKVKKTGRTEKSAQTPNTADAIVGCLGSGSDCRIFQRKGSFRSTEHSELISSVLAELSETGEGWARDESSASEIVVPSEPIRSESRHVVLTQWAIKLVRGEDGVFGLVVLGIIKETDNIAQSSFINKRLSSHCVMSKSTTYTLEGQFDNTFTPYPGFRPEALQRFKDGFPAKWSFIINTEISQITGTPSSPTNLTNPQPPKAQSNPNPNPNPQPPKAQTSPNKENLPKTKAQTKARGRR
ncbi:hypothetical protein NEDG_01807 [Nematocida displodere]|uniref:SANTA domain-containing protein n=1 Tax=Nematocida displodere TaxID=1805483 RepID=A0A177EK21_9MICR|nr:hypothetical protein NEDG_01807 [Nematocida displodere]